MQKKLITIFTPTYNRSKLLERLFESLMKQTKKNFEWLVVDDGSTDNTSDVINGFKTIADFEINYYYKENGGKHTAHNMAVLKCKTKYFLILDSDDFLSSDAIEILNEKIKIIEKNETVSGIIGNRYDLSGQVIGNKMPLNVKYATGAELYELHKLNGDTLRLYKTKILKLFLFPIFDSEKFVPENIVFDKIDNNYKMLVITEKLYYCDYQNEGYSNNIFNHNLISPKGYALSLFSFYKSAITLKNKVKWMLLYQIWCFRFPDINFIDRTGDKIIYILLRPISYLFNFFKFPKFMFGKDNRKKALILTLYGNYNFGNKLQNYALQKVLIKLGFNVETLKIKYRHLSYYKNIKKIIGDVIKYIINFNRDRKRLENFYEFNKKYLKYSKKNYSVNSYFDRKLECYDYYVFGSDQIWNPSCFGDSQLFLGYKSNCKKNIVYSGSFGISELEDKLKIKYKNGLKNFNYMSVREDAGKKIIEELTNRKDVDVLIDPTLLLTTEEWDKLSKKPKFLKSKKYILNYFLGELNEERKKEINRIAKENDCEIINILDKNSLFYQCGPSEFLHLEKNAFLICTDSFHSCVFAFLYNRPFIIFERDSKNVENMSSRLDTLISKFKLKNRKFDRCISYKNLKHNYSEGYKILEEERIKANKFLKKALNINNKIGDVDE